MSAHRNSCISSFPICVLFLLLFVCFCLIAMARMSGTMFKKNEHTSLVPDLTGKAFSLSPLNMIYAVEVSSKFSSIPILSF